ncbi:HAD family hydrolase [Roseimaritima ulvae]|uniref:Phosphorylated carbohydrates phosphatase n=1 Tax=Roseimaritima ulvae TaxID=980254 RepID=A0A5B9QRT6_9BACT|nr:HAD-IA family hydrolase [Roseimaritima ulvae]QEG40055.1 Phosphorylated carbohydrates phosphatase [Roseimaritima ulvae]
MDDNEILGVALDLDGLLYDTEPLYWQVGSQLLARRDHVFTDQLQRQMMGRPGVQAMQVLIDQLNLPDDPQHLLDESDEIYAGILAAGLQPMPGLMTWIQALEASGLPFGVATSSRRRFAEEILQRDALRQRLQFLLTGEDVTHGKPHPEMYLKAAAALQIDPARMLVLEDSENGCAAAVAAGAVTVAIPGAHSVGHQYDGAHLVAQRLDDQRLLNLIST